MADIIANPIDVKAALNNPNATKLATPTDTTIPASTLGFAPQTNPPATSTPSTGTSNTTPVITGSSAAKDYEAKQTATNDVNNGIATQAATVAANNAAASTPTTTDNSSQVLSEIQSALADNPNADPYTLGLNDAPPAGATKTYDSTPAPQGYKYMYDSAGDRVAVLDNPSTGALNQQSKDVAAEQEDLYQSLKTQVTNLQNGTIPLTPAQQSQVNAVIQQFQQLEDAQKLANKNYTGGVTNAGIASGRQRYSPDLALSEIQDSVTTGLQKVADLEAKASEAVSKLTIAFQNEDYDAVNKVYAQMQTALDGKTKAINDMMTQINNSTKAAVTQITNQQKLDQAQQKIDNSTAQAALKFATAHNIQTPYYVVGGAVFSTKDGHWISPDEAKQVGLDTQNQDMVTNVETKGDTYVVKNQKINIGGTTHIVDQTFDATGKMISQTDAGVAGATPKAPGSNKNGLTPAQIKAGHAATDAQFTTEAGKDGKVSNETWNQAADAFVDSKAGTYKDFYLKHSNFVDLSHAQDYKGAPTKAGTSGSIPIT